MPTAQARPRCAQALPERRAEPIPRIGQHGPEPYAGGQRAVDLGQRHLRLGPGRTPRVRHASLVEPDRVARPGLRQEQAQRDGNRHLAGRKGQGHQRLAVRGLAQSRRVLRRDPGRVLALLGQGRVVHHEPGIRTTHQAVSLGQQRCLERCRIPHARRDEVVQGIVARQPQPFGHRLHALAITRPDQPGHVERAHRLS